MEIIDNNDIDQKLNIEYNRYETTNDIINNVYKKYGYNDKIKYEFKNIFERWLLNSSNLCIKNTEKNKDFVYFDGLIDDFNHEINQKLVSEILEKNIVQNKFRAEEILLFIIKRVKKYFDDIHQNNKNKNKENIKITQKNNLVIITYKLFSKKINLIRYQNLLKKGTLEDIMVAALRYASIISSSQHWSMPTEVYKMYVEKYGVNIEGFASPFNSQLLLLGLDYKFCSLFKDTDEIFGSFGSFFSANFSAEKDAVIAVNPPYVLDIINNTADKCINECKKTKENKNRIKFFIIFSAWKDTHAYEELSKSEFLRYTVELPPEKHYYIDANDVDDNGVIKKIPARFTTVLFILSQGYDDNMNDYNNILTNMLIFKS